MFRILSLGYRNFEEWLCAACLAVMVACLLAQVAVRNLLQSSLAWSEELSRYAFVWAVFIGAALVAKHARHVRITAQFSPFSIRTRLALRIVADSVWVGFLLYLAWTCTAVIVSMMAFPEISPTLGIEKAYVEFVVPFGFLLTAWRVVEDYLYRWRRGDLTALIEGETV